MLRTFFVFLFFLQYSIGTSNAHSDAVLSNFFKNTNSASGKFIQSNVIKENKVQEIFSGFFSFRRSDRSFKWVIEKPYSQIILSNGSYIFQYDKELSQLIEKKLDQSYEDSPVTTIFGKAEIKKDFIIKKLSNGNKLKWFRLIPKEKNTSFMYIDLGFNKDLLEQIEFLDFFNKKIRINFLEIKINPMFHNNEFLFSTPENSEVIKMYD